MINIIDNEYDNLVAFEFVGDITQEQLNNIVLPRIEKLVDEINEINLLYLINTDLKNFDLGAWYEDAKLGLTNITKWNRTAIVTDKAAVRTFTELFSKVIPGTFKGFDKSELSTAYRWVSKGDNN